VPGYWAKDLPVNVGTDNLGELRFDYFRDAGVAFEAFTAGALDWRTENVAKNWATEYDFPAVLKREVVREEFPIRSVGTMQAFAFNIRRPKFRDPRVRRAFNFAFDFEKINQELFYGAYTRISSYFDGTELASSGLPEGRELGVLQAVRSEMPPEVFTTPYWNPISNNDAAERANLLEAMRLLSEAGFEVRDLALIDPNSGEQVEVEFLIGDRSLDRIALFYQPQLQRLGIKVTVRSVDDVQYVNRLRDSDFDIVIASWEETLTPGNEQRDYWGARAADTAGSRNLIGIKNLGTLPSDTRLNPGPLCPCDIAGGSAGGQRPCARQRAIDVRDEMGPVLFSAVVKRRRAPRLRPDESSPQRRNAQ
jgi:microcin C transport system substrate-binding protein